MTPIQTGAVNAAVIVSIARALFSKPQNGAEFLETVANSIDEKIAVSQGDIRVALEMTRQILIEAGA